MGVVVLVAGAQNRDLIHSKDVPDANRDERPSLAESVRRQEMCGWIGNEPHRGRLVDDARNPARYACGVCCGMSSPRRDSSKPLFPSHESRDTRARGAPEWPERSTRDRPSSASPPTARCCQGTADCEPARTVLSRSADRAESLRVREIPRCDVLPTCGALRPRRRGAPREGSREPFPREGEQGDRNRQGQPGALGEEPSTQADPDVRISLRMQSLRRFQTAGIRRREYSKHPSDIIQTSSVGISRGAHVRCLRHQPIFPCSIVRQARRLST